MTSTLRRVGNSLLSNSLKESSATAFDFEGSSGIASTRTASVMLTIRPHVDYGSVACMRLFDVVFTSWPRGSVHHLVYGEFWVVPQKPSPGDPLTHFFRERQIELVAEPLEDISSSLDTLSR